MLLYILQYTVQPSPSKTYPAPNVHSAKAAEPALAHGRLRGLGMPKELSLLRISGSQGVRLQNISKAVLA